MNVDERVEMSTRTSNTKAAVTMIQLHRDGSIDRCLGTKEHKMVKTIWKNG